MPAAVLSPSLLYRRYDLPHLPPPPRRAAQPVACTFYTNVVCVLSMPTTKFYHFGKFCSNLLKFHSNF
jgi:hypothetical protein